MLRRITRDILRDDEFKVEIKSNFISVNLGDDLSFKTQFEKFKEVDRKRGFQLTFFLPPRNYASPDFPIP